MATSSYEVAVASDRVSRAQGDGWLVFSVTLLSLAGLWNVFDGLLAIGKSKVYGPASVYVFSDLRTWGWIVLGLGVLLLVAALTILSGSQFGRWFGITAAGVNAIGQLAFVPVAPFWALTMFTVDLLVIYALAVYGGRVVRDL